MFLLAFWDLCTTVVLKWMTRGNDPSIYSITMCEPKTKACARSKSFQRKLQHRCLHLWFLPDFVTSLIYCGQILVHPQSLQRFKYSRIQSSLLWEKCLIIAYGANKIYCHLLWCYVPLSCYLSTCPSVEAPCERYPFAKLNLSKIYVSRILESVGKIHQTPRSS